MEVKKIISCPQCGVKLEITNTKQEAVKKICCPKCKVHMKVSFEDTPANGQAAPPPPPARQAAQPAEEDKTQLGTPPPAAGAYASARPALLFQGRRYYLREGVNIVGRAATSSPANIQMPTADVYMSRQHALITISKLPDGTTQATLTNYKNKNDTYVKNMRLEPGDEIALQNNNAIRMGDTLMIYVEY